MGERRRVRKERKRRKVVRERERERERCGGASGRVLQFISSFIRGGGRRGERERRTKQNKSNQGIFRRKEVWPKSILLHPFPF